MLIQFIMCQVYCISFLCNIWRFLCHHAMYPKKVPRRLVEMVMNDATSKNVLRHQRQADIWLFKWHTEPVHRIFLLFRWDRFELQHLKYIDIIKYIQAKTVRRMISIEQTMFNKSRVYLKIFHCIYHRESKHWYAICKTIQNSTSLTDGKCITFYSRAVPPIMK